MNAPTPRFTGIFIPVEVLEHPDLTMLEQLLLSWIDALYCKTHRGCYAKNEYFAERLKVKENTIAKALTSLRQKNLIEDVSFDGRNRIIRAKIGEHVQKVQSNAGLDLNPMQGLTEIQPRVGEKSIATYIESKEESKEDITPPIPPQIPEPSNAAKAAPNESKDSPKPKREKPDFSPRVREVANNLLQIVVDDSPSYIIPKNLTAFLQEVHNMLTVDKRDPEKLYAVLRVTLPDPFYGPGLLNGNLAKKLRDKFVTLEKKMNSKPPVNPNQVDKRLREKDGTVVDAYKDMMF